MSEFYQLTPEYHEEIRRLQRSDPADAEDTFNPLFQAILENILAVKTGLEDHNQSTNAHADIRQVLGGNMDALLADLAAHTGNQDNPHQTDYEQTGADKKGSAAAVQAKLEAHNLDANSHADMRTLIGGGLDQHNADASAHADIRKTVSDLGKNMQSGLETRIAQLESQLASEISARQSLASRVSATESSLRRTSYFVTGTYNGSGSSNTQTISIGFQPRAVLVVAYRGYYEEQHDRTCVQLAVRGANAKLVSITSSGFSVKGMLNGDGSAENPYRYLAMA